MLDDLEKYICENRDKFDREEPFVNHKSRFEKKLSERPRFSRKNRHLFMVAASLTLLLTASVFLFLKESPKSSIDSIEKGMSLSDVSPKMEEVEVYMSNKISEKITYLKTTFSEDNQYVVDCISRIKKLEMRYGDLKAILSDNQGEEVVINSMIINYETRLELVNLLLEQLVQKT